MDAKDKALTLAMVRLQQRAELEGKDKDAGTGTLFLGIIMIAIPGLAASEDLDDPLGALRDVRELTDALIRAGEE